jgi:histidinol-phosphate/aromatic aminotransferase/cobyric acid decarboxylase-like protein
MDPDAVRTVERVPHGGADDHDVLDFSANVNPDRPAGVSPIYESALPASGAYPSDDYCEFRVAAGEYLGCEPSDVVPTPGGLAALRLAIGTLVHSGDSVLVPYPSFGEYAREVRLQGADPVFVHHVDLPDRDPSNHDFAVLCNPNSPTGDAYGTDRLLGFADRCRAAGTPLFVDEAFLGFTERASLAGQDGVVVGRSLTKLFGLPGIRAGFAVATGDLNDALETGRRTWNLSVPAASVGAHCLRQDEFVERTRQRVREERERMVDALSDDFDVHPSDAPFLLLGVGDRDPDDVLGHAREHGIVLRDARTFRGLDDHVRVAVHKREANDRLLDVLADV